MNTKPKISHELIDNISGEVLAQAFDAEQFIEAARYIVKAANLSTSDISYVIIVNGDTGRGRLIATADKLDALLDDSTYDTWNDEGGNDPDVF